MAVPQAASVSRAARPRARLTGVVARLTAANVFGAATGFITGPLLARALGASGRGDLAAIVVPLSLAPAVLSLGISSYAYRKIPRGGRVEEVLGSLGLPLLVIGAITAAAAVPAADALAGGRETVRAYLIVGVALMPLWMLTLLLSSSLAALERWRAVVAMNLIPFAVVFVAVVALYAAGELTVATAAIAQIAASVLTVVPAIPLLLRSGRPVFRLPLARDGISFGIRAWVGGLAQLANLRLDQFLMITAVAPRQLGLYAVAVTIAGASGLATGALAPPLMTRIAGGHTELIPQAVRITVSATLILNIAIGGLTPLLVDLLFGPDFHGAIEMAWILLAGQVLFSGASVLGTALQGDGAPLIPTIGELLALMVTVIGLLALLKPLGGVGAAVVSVAAYGTSFCFQLLAARRRTGVPLAAFLVPSRSDARWARGLIGRARAGGAVA